ncbi:acyl carrier protein [Endozoicomonas atrinae]|uniref:acyl carrier protein n=1 Tax=Endozoicomonas atrinae TaxID=1333660 RepID=UPI00082679AF|nr:acyl carrier protein [Endozoicomonas atrinae]
MNKEDILSALKDILAENFEIEPEAVTLDAHLYEDLDLDSIDAVDLVVALQELTGKKIKPEEFKTVRTVEDVVSATETLLAEEAC